MNTTRCLLSCALSLVLAAALASLAAGCETAAEGATDAPMTTTTTTQQDWSPMSEGDRAAVRAVLDKFNANGLQPIDASDIVDVIVQEGTRVFGGPWAGGSMKVSGGSLDLTSSEVLPEWDAAGHFEASGGFLAFDEVVHDVDGQEVSQVEAHKPHREFLRGALSSFAFARTVDSPTPYYVYERDSDAFTAGSEIAYQETAWNQTKGWIEAGGAIYGETYGYQSHPVRTITLDSGSSSARDMITQDEILSTTGWRQAVTASETPALRGTYTLYRPSLANAEPNQAPAHEVETTTDAAGDIETTITAETTVDEAEGVVGWDGELREKVVTTTTSSVKTVRDTAHNRELEWRQQVHRTTQRSYAVREGRAAAAIRNHALERFVDHHETTKTMDSRATSYPDDTGSFERVESQTEYRYTDDPATRNDIWAWRSTRTETRTSYAAADGTTVVQRKGTTWLTDQIEADPDASQTAFALSGETTYEMTTQARFFGADDRGLEQTTSEAQRLDVTAEWAGAQVSASGAIENHAASIAVDGVEHEHTGDWDGTVSLSFGGMSFSVSAEEWLAALMGP